MAAAGPSLPARVRVVEEVAWREVDGAVVLIDLAGGEYYSFDEVGTRMWQLLDSEPDTETALRALLEEYEVDEARLRSDLSEFIEKLVDMNVLQID